MKYRLIGTVLVIAGLSSGSCSHAQSPKPDCNRSLDTLKDETQQMVKKGQYDAAQKKAAFYKPCFGNDADYWIMRITALKSSNPREKPSHKDALKGVKFIDNAIHAAPERSYLEVVKASMLLTAREYESGERLYEKRLKYAVNRANRSASATISDAVLIETAPYYIDALKRQNDNVRARRHLRPFLSHVCSGMPKLKNRYATNLISIHQVFDGKEPSVPKDPGTRAQALKEACASFRP